MSDRAKELIAAVLALPAGERLQVADAVYDALPRPPGMWSTDDPGFADELNRRVAEMDSGRDPGTPAEEVMREFRQKYG